MAKSSRLQSPLIRVGNAHQTIPFKTLVFDFVAPRGRCRAEWTLRVARSSFCLTSSSPIPSRHVSELVRASRFVQLFSCQGPCPAGLEPAGGGARGRSVSQDRIASLRLELVGASPLEAARLTPGDLDDD